MTATSNSQTQPIRVAKVVDEFTLVINRGLANGVKPGHRFLVYSVGEEILDPATQEPLGHLEVIKGTGKAVHVQDQIATIRSDMKESPQKTIRKIKNISPFIGLGTGEQEIEEYLPAEMVPFEGARTGDFVKQI